MRKADLQFIDDYDRWYDEVTRRGAFVLFEEDHIFRAFVGAVKVGAFGGLPGHGYYLRRILKMTIEQKCEAA